MAAGTPAPREAVTRGAAPIVSSAMRGSETRGGGGSSDAVRAALKPPSRSADGVGHTHGTTRNTGRHTARRAPRCTHTTNLPTFTCSSATRVPLWCGARCGRRNDQPAGTPSDRERRMTRGRTRRAAPRARYHNQSAYVRVRIRRTSAAMARCAADGDAQPTCAGAVGSRAEDDEGLHTARRATRASPRPTRLR